MPNSNSLAVAVANQKARVMADMMAQTYATAKSLVNYWNANNISAVIPNDNTIIADGSDVDGRQPVTNANVTSIITRAQEIVTDYEEFSNAKLNTILQVSVNGESRF